MVLIQGIESGIWRKVILSDLQTFLRSLLTLFERIIA